jgi:hypothetical protein
MWRQRKKKRGSQTKEEEEGEEWRLRRDRWRPLRERIGTLARRGTSES